MQHLTPPAAIPDDVPRSWANVRPLLFCITTLTLLCSGCVEEIIVGNRTTESVGEQETQPSGGFTRDAPSVAHLAELDPMQCIASSSTSPFRVVEPAHVWLPNTQRNHTLRLTTSAPIRRFDPSGLRMSHPLEMQARKADDALIVELEGLEAGARYVLSLDAAALEDA